MRLLLLGLSVLLTGSTPASFYERGQRLLEQQLDVAGAAELLAESIARQEPERARACFLLGFLFANEYLPGGIERGIRLYEHASRISDVVVDEVELALGARYFMGNGVKQNMEKAVHHYQRLAQYVHTVNSKGRQRTYDWVRLYNVEAKEAKEKEVSEVEDAHQMLETLPEDDSFRGENAFFVGNMHEHGGRGQSRNQTRACEYYELASSLGHLKGMVSYSRCLLTAGNASGAVAILENAAGTPSEGGYPRAQFQLGSMLWRGQVSGTDLKLLRDHDTAAEPSPSPSLADWGKRQGARYLWAAADNGSGFAAFQLGFIAFTGNDVRQYRPQYRAEDDEASPTDQGWEDAQRLFVASAPLHGRYGMQQASPLQRTGHISGAFYAAVTYAGEGERGDQGPAPGCNVLSSGRGI